MNKNKIIIALVIVFGFVIIIILNSRTEFWKSFQKPMVIPICDTQIIKINGQLSTFPDQQGKTVTSSEQAYYLIKKANDNKAIKVIVVELDSTGGSSVAAEEIAKTLQAVTKPTLVYIRDQASGPTYLIASVAKRIFAAGLSVISFGLDPTTTKVKSEQVAINDLNYKLVGLIGAYRNTDYNVLAKFSNGAKLLGFDAKGLGLVDEIGGLDEVRAYIKLNILSGVEPKVCW